jgi:integrase
VDGEDRLGPSTLDQAGGLIPNCSSSRFRRRAGVHPKVVQEPLGHATIAITLDIYSHAIPAMQEDAAAKIAALLEG